VEEIGSATAYVTRDSCQTSPIFDIKYLFINPYFLVIFSTIYKNLMNKELKGERRGLEFFFLISK
jgi:hypothetical protein